MAGVGLSWWHREGHECLRVEGLADAAAVGVWPAAAGDHGSLPAMAGSWVRENGGLCFVPRFAFVDGESYVVVADGVRLGQLARPRRMPESPAAEVAAIFPTSPVLPRNILRFYVWFTAPMSEGSAADHIGLVDGDGLAVLDAVMPTEDELWDADRRRLTVLMDPARIKRGLVSNQVLGYPLRTGQTVRLVVGDGYPDARGVPLKAGSERSYLIGTDERGLVDLARWRLEVPGAGTTEPLRVEFDRPLDHALLGRCLRVADREGRTVAGRAGIGPGESTWVFAPHQVWSPAPYELAVQPILEDLAGNSVERVFDRDLEVDLEPPQGPSALAFRPSN